MTSKEKAALAMGLLGALCTLLLLFIPAYYVVRFGSTFLRGGPDGPEQWQTKSDSRLAEEASRELQTAELGLRERYTVVPFFEDTRTTLYRDKDFATVEARLEAQWAKDDQYERFVYGRCVGDLVPLTPGESPEVMLSVLNEWVAASPDSYRARLVRGRFYISYAWYYRGTGWASTVSRKSWNEFDRLVALAQEDLETAHQMFPSDPNAAISQITIAMGRGDGEAVEQFHYNRAIAVDPLNVMARLRMFYARLPQWGGSWAEVDAIVAEAKQASAAFPMLGIIERIAANEMRSRSPEHAAALESLEVKRSWITPYVNQLERNPNARSLEYSVAFYASGAREYILAEEYYRRLGDTYFDLGRGSGAFRDLLQFNDFRANAYARVAYDLPLGPERTQRAAEAYDLAPTHYYTNYFMGLDLMQRGEHDAAIPYFEFSKHRFPGFGWHTFRLAEIAEAGGDHDEAIRLVNESMDICDYDSLHESARKMLDRLSTMPPPP